MASNLPIRPLKLGFNWLFVLVLLNLICFWIGVFWLITSLTS